MCFFEKIFRVIGVALLISSLSALAAPPPQPTSDAGQILQQIERDIEVKPLPTLPTPKVQEPVVEEAQAEMVVVKEFKFEGNQVLTNEVLQVVLEPLKNRSISITELKSSLDLIANIYRQKGYIAIATLPEQDITEGVVLIKIVEAAFGGVKIDGIYNKDYKRISPVVIERIIGAKSPKGQVLNQENLDRALGLMQRLSGFEVTSNLQAGQEDNTTDVLLKVTDHPLLTFGLAADNSGGQSTGKSKTTATVDVASPLKQGDIFNVTLLHTQGTDYSHVAYTLPVGARGLQIGSNASHMVYKFIEPMEGGYTPLGHSYTYKLNATYPIILSNNKNLNVEMDYEKKYFLNKMSSPDQTAIESDYKVDVFSVLISGNYVDGFLAGAQNNASINLGFGNVNLDGSPNKTRDLEGSNTQGNYKRLHWNLSRNQFFTDSLSLNLDASGQAANRNLDSSEKFYLGGINGVRAYPTSEGSGSDGYLLKVELHKYLPHNFHVSVFVDKGYVKQYHVAHTFDGTSLPSEGPNSFTLKGLGATVSWSGPYKSLFKTTYSHRMGKNPNPSTLDHLHDQDGTLLYDVLWFNASASF